MSEIIINEELIKKICTNNNLPYNSVLNTIKLIHEGNTIPFIARYRKEMTNNLDEEKIFAIKKEYDYKVSLEERKEKIINAIEKKGKLTQEVIDEINKCEKLSELENIYKPYVEKKKTRAANAINLGLQPLADYLLTLPRGEIKQEVEKYINEKVNYDDAINGAKDIIAEIISDNNDIRKILKSSIYDYGYLITKLKNEENDKELTYKLYYDSRFKINKLQAHKIMAIGRAEKEKVINVKYEFDKTFATKQAIWTYTKNYKSEAATLIVEAINDGFSRLLIPSVENEVWSDIYEKAQEKSINIFSRNLENILTIPPLKEKNVLGIDPAFRTGCKLALVNKNNDMLLIETIYPNEPHNKVKESESILLNIFNNNEIDIIAIGNGTASRETELFINNFLIKNKINIPHVIVSEAGASVYSASEKAIKEFPELSVEKRSAISIARRVIDPLTELIKIDPKSIGVGQYQHDLPQKELEQNLSFTIEKIINRIGVDINTSSEELLTHISGLNKSISKSIIEYRKKNGKINSREELKNISKISDKVFEQAAGFIRIKNGSNILDETSIHPDDYNHASKIIDKYKIDLNKNNENLNINQKDIEEISKELNINILRVSQIIDSIKQQRRDYRDQFDAPLLRNDVLSFENLKIGMHLPGTIRNIVDFGAFIDIGIKEDGLLHISSIKKDTKDVNPFDLLNIGQIINVYIKNLDEKTRKVELSLYE